MVSTPPRSHERREWPPAPFSATGLVAHGLTKNLSSTSPSTAPSWLVRGVPRRGCAAEAVLVEFAARLRQGDRRSGLESSNLEDVEGSRPPLGRVRARRPLSRGGGRAPLRRAPRAVTGGACRLRSFVEAAADVTAHFGDGERQPVDQGEGPRAGQDGGLLSGQRVDCDDQAVPVADLATRRARAEPSISARTSRS
jgi:hypothetical protein